MRRLRTMIIFCLLSTGIGACVEESPPSIGSDDATTLRDPSPPSTEDSASAPDRVSPSQDTSDAAAPPSTSDQPTPSGVADTTSADLSTPGNTADSTSVPQTPGTPAEYMKRRVVKNAQQRLAICNKGDDFAYYFRRGTGSGTTRWIVFLKGGGSCMSADECRRRGKVFTAAPTEEYRKPGGIMVTNPEVNPKYYNWNHVYLYYCSSDVWIGDRAASPETGNLHFRGYRIVKAVIEDLMDPALTPAPNLAQATHVILSGGSAGAHGTANNLNHVAAMLPASADLVGIVDSGLSVPVLPYGQTEPNPNPTPSTSADFWNAVVDPFCLAEQGNRNQCISPFRLRKYFQRRAFFYVDQADPKALQRYNITDIHDPDQQAWVINSWAPAQRAVLEAQPAGCFATFTHTHTALISAKFYTLKIDGLSYYQVFTNWYLDTGGPTKVIALEPQGPL